MARSVVSVDVRTGRLLWRHEHKTPYGMNVTTPIVRDGRVLASSGYGAGGRLLEILPGGKGVRQAWLATDLDNCHTGVLLIDGLLYGSGCRTSEKGFACVDFKTGKTLWIDRALWKVSVTFADGLLYALGHEGRMSLVEIGPKGCRVISAFDLPKKDRYECLAHPVVCGGRLYIRQAETLTAFEVRAPASR
jgi:outer membrane protein assembly factor BamB